MDPLVALTFAIQSSPGLYALFLGSGLSRGAGVPTGWEVVLDLIRKIAKLEGVDPEPDPPAWYRIRFGEEPDYSRLLERISGSSAERAQLLRGYFEPTEDERERGLKLASAAHRAIAELVAGGYIRVIVTTNFDRLIEQALEAAGVIPTVVSSADAIEGMLPLPHVRCLVVKIHGDYHDTRIRNTPAELENYDARQDGLLDRILDEYGVVVCGWSADWDIALRRAFERARNRRFSMFWAARGALGPAAQSLVTLRNAQVITISSADGYFSDLASKVQALADTAAQHPMSVKAAVAETKRYLPEERFRIRLHDLVIGEIDRVIQESTGPIFARATGAVPQEFFRRLQLSDGVSEVLRAILVTGCWWGDAHQVQHWVAALERLANSNITLGINAEFGHYPTLAALYAAGISAVAAGKLDVLGALLIEPKVRVQNEEYSIVTRVYPGHILNPETAKLMPGYERNYTPLNNYLHTALRPGLRDQVPDDARYDDCFDRFEYLVSIVYADYSQREGDTWSPIGRFGWKLKNRTSRTAFPEQLAAEVKAWGNEWPLFRGRLFDGSTVRVLELMDNLNERIGRLPWH